MTDVISSTEGPDLCYRGGKGLELCASSPDGKKKFREELLQNEEVVQTLYRICYKGRGSKKQMMSSVCKFTGWDENFHNIKKKEDDLNDKKKFPFPALKSVAKILNLKPKSTRVDLVEELTEFFKEPYKVEEITSTHSTPSKKKKSSPAKKSPAKVKVGGKTKTPKAKLTAKAKAAKATKATKAKTNQPKSLNK